MSTSKSSWGLAVFAVASLSFTTAHAQHGVDDGQWPNYSGDKGATKYSALDQITPDNMGSLEVAWQWASPDNAVLVNNPRQIPGAYKVTPLMVGDTLYAATTYNMATAIDAKTGETKWTFDPKVWEGARPGNLGFNSRGLSYWSDGAGNERIFLGTQHNYLYALDPKTGELIEGFGKDGVVDLIEPYRRPVDRRYVWAISPGLVVGDVIIFGRAINDGPTRKEMPPGDVMAFDVRTGEHKWTFHNPPQKGEPGYDSWKDGSAEYTGNANVWTHMSADPELGLVYLPFGTPTNDWYGGHRKGDGLFAESIVCVKAETGELVWYFQHVHHGLWDYDLPTAPALANVTVDGKPRKVLAQITKQGFCWVLDRTTGEPIWPIEEKPVPQSTVPGEESSPTQPFPTKPKPYDQQGSTEDLLIDFTPELRAEALEILNKYNHGPLYTPPMVDKETIYNPGWGGGANWSGLSVDPDTGVIYIPSASGQPITMKLTKPNPDISNFDYVGGVGRIAGPQGLPLFKGPYSRVTAIDLNSGDHIWQVPLGEGLEKHPALAALNLPPQGAFGGGHPLLTKTMLMVTAGGGRGDGGAAGKLYAFDKKTGDMLQEYDLPVRPSGTPMTYALNGKQYIAVAYGGGRSEAGIVALSLP